MYHASPRSWGAAAVLPQNPLLILKSGAERKLRLYYIVLTSLKRLCWICSQNRDAKDDVSTDDLAATTVQGVLMHMGLASGISNKTSGGSTSMVQKAAQA